jgi:hypothetical protein
VHEVAIGGSSDRERSDICACVDESSVVDAERMEHETNGVTLVAAMALDFCGNPEVMRFVVRAAPPGRVEHVPVRPHARRRRKDGPGRVRSLRGAREQVQHLLER